jgi:2-polyprenyl-6-methoxyphenol hydroxylase-like FAD-dependent oxidoreductase
LILPQTGRRRRALGECVEIGYHYAAPRSRRDLRRNTHLRKFSLFAHFEGVDREAGIDGTLTQMIRGKDRWIWIIPITAKKTSIGVVVDAQAFKRMKLEPEEAFDQILQENPEVTKQLLHAHRVTEVHATGDFSFRNKHFTGARWVLAGDAAGFIDPVWSSGVFIAILSGEKAADMLDRVLTTTGKACSRICSL